MLNQPIVAVLAGGASTRMGTDKALVLIDGSTMLDRVLTAAGRVGDPVVIGRTSVPHPFPAVPDLRKDAHGPLSGLETALTTYRDRTVVLVAVDHPFLRPETIEHLLDMAGDAVVPVHEGWQQVTCAVYRPAFLDAAASVLDAGCRSIITALDQARTTLVAGETWRSWNEDGRSWYSVDSPDRVAEGIRRYT